MTAKYLHLGFTFRGGRSAPTQRIQEVLNKARDWVRYAPNCYILYTTADVQTWYGRLRDVIHERDHILVVELNIENRQGWLPKSIWDWIRRDRS